MVSRFIQAFGGSVGSVLGQAICRDAFHGSALGKIYSSIGTALAFFPAIGPVIGGFIAESFGWPSVFIFLTVFAIFLFFSIKFFMPETHYIDDAQEVRVLDVVLKLLKDRRVLGFGIIVASCNGIAFSYFAEGSFCLIKILGLSPIQYGWTFVGSAISSMLGGIISKRLHNTKTAEDIMCYGVSVMLCTSAVFSALMVVSYIVAVSNALLISVIIISQILIMFGMCMTISNSLALALRDYKWCIGTASSLFGFFYYTLISFFTLIMGLLHNETLLPMPLYFLAITLMMLLVKKLMLRENS